MRDLRSLLQTFFKRNHGAYLGVSLLLFLGTCAFTLASPQATKADDLPVVHVSGTLTENTVWTTDNVYVVDDLLTVPSGVTLTINAGAVVKYATGGFVSIKVNSGATLTAAGTSSSPITFTSLRDDSVGGDTAGDGTTTGSVGEYTSDIAMNGGTVTVAHASFAYANSAVSDEGGNGSTLTMTDSVFEHLNEGVNLTSSSEAVTMQRNQFTLATSVHNGYAVSVSSNSNVTGIVLAGANENTFTGSGHNIVVRLRNSNSIPTGVTWTVASSSGAVLESNGTLTVNGTLAMDDSTTLVLSQSDNYSVSVNGDMTIGKGVIVKNDTSGSIKVNSGGILSGVGTSTNPITFTSLNDDGVGGDTAGNGSTVGVTGEYSSDIAINGGTVAIAYANFTYAGRAIGDEGTAGSSLTIANSTFSHVNHVAYLMSHNTQANFDNVTISYAGDGLEIQNNIQVGFRGSFSNISGKAIKACNWSDGSDCEVDAAYTNWGSASGPFASNPSDSMVCGAVTVSPWQYGTSTYDKMSIFNIKNCDGSLTSEDQLSTAVSGFQSRINSEQIDCNNGFQDACDQIQRTFSCINAAVGLALYNSPFPAPSSSPTDAAATYSGDIVSGSTTYVQGVETGSTASRASVLSAVGEVLGIFGALTNAYNTCN